MKNNLLDAKIQREALSGPIAVLLTDSLGAVSWCNASAEDFLYATTVEIIGKTLPELADIAVLHETPVHNICNVTLKNSKNLGAAHCVVQRPTGNAHYFFPLSNFVDDLQKLKNDEAKMRFALEASGHAVWDFRPAHNGLAECSTYSENWRLLRGMSAEDVAIENFQAWIKRIHPDDQNRVAELIRKQDRGEVVEVAYEYRERHADGHYIWILARGKAIEHLPSGLPVYFVGVDVDITKLKNDEKAQSDYAISLLQGHTHQLEQAKLAAERALKEAEISRFAAESKANLEAIWRKAVDASGFGVWSYNVVRNGKDASSVVDICSDAWFTMRGAEVGDPSLNELDTWYDRVHPDDLETVMAGIEKQINGADDDVSFEYRERHSAGHWVWILVRGKTIVRDEQGRPLRVVGLDMDISSIKEEALRAAEETEYQHSLHIAELRNATMLAEQAQNEAQIIARTDTLTNLANRRLFREQVTDLASTKTSFAVLIIDLNRFKRVNELHGHAVGDMVLRETAKRLTATVGQAGVVARLGGDEFSLVLTATDNNLAANIDTISQKIISILAFPIAVGDLNFQLGATIGSAASLSRGDDYEKIMHRADMALQYAKSDTRGTHVSYSNEMGASADDRAELERDLKRAVAELQIETWFQPILNAANDCVEKLEVLARWQHPKRGFVPPDQFIALAQYLGLLPTLSMNLLRAACEKAAPWHNVRLSFNISASEASDINMPLRILNTLQSTGFEPSRLEIEITEQAFLDDLEAAKSVVANLRKIGIKVYVDDFGEGYAGIGYLRDFEVDGIKFDRSCVSNICKKPAAATFLKSLQLMAATMNLDTVAEGIETQDVWEMVKSLGCTYGQGYLFSKALPAHEIAQFLIKHAGTKPRLIA